MAIKTLTDELRGYLFVGRDHLPELTVFYDQASRMGMATWTGPLRYTPALFPAAWELQQAEPDAGILFCAWRTIAELQWDIAQAERQTEDDAKERERDRSIDNTIAEELGHE